MIEYKNKFPQAIIFPVTLDNYNLSELDTRFKTPFEIQKAANKCDYHRQAIQFLRDTKSKIVIERGGIDATSEDEWRRERYKFTCTLSRMKGAKEYKMSFPFWGCSVNAGVPRGLAFNRLGHYEQQRAVRKGDLQAANVGPYDVLACLDVYTPELFDDFCSEFGYEFNNESEYIKVKQLHLDCINQVRQLQNLYTSEELEQLAEIC